jgi:hypothetical protein
VRKLVIDQVVKRTTTFSKSIYFTETTANSP